MDYQHAVDKANRLAQLRNEAMFVIRESGIYYVASDMDLDTFFMGISDHDILYCTADAVN